MKNIPVKKHRRASLSVFIVIPSLFIRHKESEVFRIVFQNIPIKQYYVKINEWEIWIIIENYTSAVLKFLSAC
ncbi:hypothetical protein D3C75_1120490 [compost metagenome]